MYTHQVRSLHAPMLIGLRGLRGLGAALPLSLTIDNPYQVVGGKPKFTLIGAVPGAKVYWSSYKDNKATGEFNADYGHVVETNGTAELEGGAWKDSDVGTWIKEVLVQDAAGKNYTAMIAFRVAATATPVTPSPGPGGEPPSSGGVLDILMNDGFFLGNTFIPYLWVLGGGVALYFFTKRR